jgi:hypothetical protein
VLYFPSTEVGRLWKREARQARKISFLPLTETFAEEPLKELDGAIPL